MSKIAILYMLLVSTYGNRTSRMKVVDYISNHAHIAIKEYHRTCIPASVKLAQAILEGGYGTSYLSVNKCNHFGIKYRWRELHKNYRVYENTIESYEDHSNYLLERCPHLLDNGNDWRAWCEGLQRANYAHSSSNYGNKLKSIILDYKLYMLDE